MHPLDELLESDRLGRLSLPVPGPGADPEDPAVSLHWLLRMAERTREARHGAEEHGAEEHGAEDGPEVERLAELLARRPARDESLGQLFIDAPSCLRRARAILDRVGAEAPILAVGDDDGVTIALALLGARALHAVDLDPRVLEFVAKIGEELSVSIEGTRADVLGAAVPMPLRGRFAAAITDPFRDLDGGLGFLTFASACLRPGGELFWVDHPEWNFEHERVRATMEALGWEVVETAEDLHAYPLSLAVFDAEEVSRGLAVELAWVRALVEQTSAWSHLLRLRRVS